LIFNLGGKKMKRYLYFIIFVFAVVMISNCTKIGEKKERDNPFDPQAVNYGIGAIWKKAGEVLLIGGIAEHASVVFNSRIWIIGGHDGAGGYYPNAVWFSIDGINWSSLSITPNPNLFKRDGHSSIVYDNKIWVIGGVYGSGITNDVWHSSDGQNWVLVTNNAEFGKRRGHTSVVFYNKMWVIGGGDPGANLKNDVWYSTDGRNWTCTTTSAGFTPRRDHSSVVFNDKIWVIGGNISSGGENDKNDVWYSPDGLHWYQATENADFSPRSGHTSVVAFDKIWVIGGISGSKSKNDVWYSADGVKWYQATSSASFEPRQEHTSVVFNNKLWVIGGMGTGFGTGKKDVWYSE